MHFFRRITRFSIGLLLSSALLAMDGQDTLLHPPYLPPELCMDFSSYLNNRNVEGMVGLWSNLDDDFWAPFTKKCFGVRASDLRYEGEAWPDVIVRYVTLRHIFSMKAWTKEDILWAISDENYVRLEKLLLKNLELSTLAFFSPLIGSANDLLAALLAYNSIYMIEALSFARGTTRWIYAENYDSNLRTQENLSFVKMIGVGTTTDSFGLWSDTIDATDHWMIAREAIDPAALTIARKGRYSFYNRRINPVYRDFGSPSKYIANAPKILNLNDRDKAGKALWKLSKLIVLANISQSGSHKLIQKVFESAKKLLDEDTFFKESKDEILTKWANEAWNKPELAENPYIATFERIALKLANLVKN